jgi:hypothetical protein
VLNRNAKLSGAKQGCGGVGILGDKETGRGWRISPLVDVSGVCEGKSQ